MHQTRRTRCLAATRRTVFIASHPLAARIARGCSEWLASEKARTEERSAGGRERPTQARTRATTSETRTRRSHYRSPKKTLAAAGTADTKRDGRESQVAAVKELASQT